VSIVVRIICLVIGYAFGLIETGIIYGKLRGVDIRQYGSGNSGATNALRVLGPKAGVVVLLGDFCKSFIPCYVGRLIMDGMYPDSYLMPMLYIGLGAILGHVFPFYLGFKGGKGIATTAGVIMSILNPYIILILLVLFVITVAISRYVSLGSILLMIEFVLLFAIFSLGGRLCFDMSAEASRSACVESIIITVVIAAIAIYKHKANIVRLLHHDENKLSFKKSGEKSDEA